MATVQHTHDGMPLPAIAADTGARLTAILDASNALLAEGFEILLVGSERDLFVKPVIWIANDRRLWDKVWANEAVYFKSGTDFLGPVRVGQFPLHGCIVMWAERGH